MIKVDRILKENYYRNFATTSQISGLTFCSFLGFVIKDYLFGSDLSNYRIGLCVIAFFLGTMMLAISFQVSLLIDKRKNIKRGDYK